MILGILLMILGGKSIKRGVNEFKPQPKGSKRRRYRTRSRHTPGRL